MMDEDLGDVLNNIQKNQAADLKNIGNDFFKNGNYEEAIKSYKSALSIDSDYIDAWNNLGLAYIKKGDLEEAKKCHERIDSIKKQENTGYSPIIGSKENQLSVTEPITKSDLDRRPFWLSIIGGILGILVGIGGILLVSLIAALTTVFGSSGSVSSPEYSGSMAVFSIAILFSIIGMIIGIVGKRKISGYLLMGSGVIVLLTTSFFGILTFIFYAIGGYLIIKNNNN